MKTHSYGINTLYQTAHVALEEGPWWAFAAQRAVTWFCDHIPRWKQVQSR